MRMRIQHSDRTIMVMLLDDFINHTEEDFDDEDKAVTFFIDAENAKELCDKIMAERRKIFLENITKDASSTKKTSNKDEIKDFVSEWDKAINYDKSTKNETEEKKNGLE